MADLFQASNGVPANFHNGNIELIVNGSSKGQKAVGTGSMGSFIDSQARYYGIKTFSVYVTINGTSKKLDTAEAGQQFPVGSTKLELVSKDARGTKKAPAMTQENPPASATEPASTPEVPAEAAPAPTTAPAAVEGDQGDETDRTKVAA